MDFTPHTGADVDRMLGALDLASPDDLFSHIPPELRSQDPAVPPPLSELEVMHHIDSLAAANRGDLTCFAGGGIYDHYLPPVVRSLTLRPEFMTSYTPYQSEVAQGVLQALWEYQSMVATVLGMPVANASLYDGASSALEAVNIAVAETRRSSIWVSRGAAPSVRQLISTFAAARDIAVIEHPLVSGRTVWNDAEEPPAAVLLAQPNYLGVIEDYEAARTAASNSGALAIAAVDPMLLGVLRSPGEAGFDVAFAEGQPLGNPMSFGGPVLGMFATSGALMRRVPGRLVGRTKDRDGRTAYTMTLRTREQDIRREKASSNICTNQTLNAVAAAVHLSWLGPQGLADTGRQSMAKAHYLAERAREVPGVSLPFDAPFGREFPLLLDADPSAVIRSMADAGYLAGIPLSQDYPDLPGGMLVAVTEKRTREELDGYIAALTEAVSNG